MIGVVGGVTNDGDSGVCGVGGATGSEIRGAGSGVRGTGSTTGPGSLATGGSGTLGSEAGSATGSGLKALLGRGPGCTGVAGVNWRKNCLFLSVTRPLPSTLMRYLLCPRSSMIRPVLSHFFAILPAPC